MPGSVLLTYHWYGHVSYMHLIPYSFGSGQISVSRYMSGICSLLGDANSQVRSCAMETIVEIYRHVGFKVRIDLSRRGLPASRMSQLTARFDAVDATTGSHESEVGFTCTMDEGLLHLLTVSNFLFTST